jgi:REP element-mobilizing transposase RayT
VSIFDSKPATQNGVRPGIDTQADAQRGRNGKAAKEQKIPTKTGNGVHFEPVSRRDYDLSYACLLIPRSSEHLLTDNATEFLHNTIKQICGLFGWRLDLIQIRPEYLQWVVSAPVSTPPSRCIHTIREQTSKGLLDKFKQFRDKNPHQDFWAPGYLVLVGSALHPPEVINEFIRLTRLQQGLGPRSG